MRQNKSVSKIAVIGNGGGGKTSLSRRFEIIYQLPLTHVDSIQFIEGLRKRDENETREILNDISDREKWIIDGFGPMDVIEQRLLKSDRVLFVDFPLWRHYWWCTKRQIKSIWNPRSELPAHCNEASISHTIRLYKILWRVHKQIRPKLLEIFARSEMTGKVRTVRTLKNWNVVFARGVE
jgi:adenylate kinase family enzyme